MDYTAYFHRMHPYRAHPLITGRLPIGMFRQGRAGSRSDAVQDGMFFPSPACAARYFKGGSLRVLFDQWS